jgi:hypothetical protein
MKWEAAYLEYANEIRITHPKDYYIAGWIRYDTNQIPIQIQINVKDFREFDIVVKLLKKADAEYNKH